MSKAYNPFKIRAVQLDLARQMETIPFIRAFVDFIRANGYNTLVLYLEGRIRTASFPYPSDDECYTPDQMRGIVSYAAGRGIEVVPVVSVLGHAELFLKHPEMEPLAETRGSFRGRFGTTSRNVFCPSARGTMGFIEKYLAEICEIFPSPLFHAGCDETWDMGCCDLCRRRIEKGETQSDIYASHLRAVYRIVAGRLGRRMIIWDDMFELYPDALDKMPRDIIMACWHYDPCVEKARGHFDNVSAADTLERYDKLGFEYLICPSDRSSRNAETFTRYGLRHRPIGGLMTTWEKSGTFMLQSMPVLACAGRLWESGGRLDYGDILRDVAKDIFGIGGDKVFLESLKSFCGNPLNHERPSGCGPFFTKRENAVDFAAADLVDLLLRTLPRYLGRVKKSSRDILSEILLSLENEQIANELQILVPEFFRPGAKLKDLSEKLGKIAARIDSVGERRARMWKRIRKGITPCSMEKIYREYSASVRKIPSLAARHGALRVHFMLPDQYSAQTTRIFVRYSGERAWHKVGEGVFKGPQPTDCFYCRIFPIEKNKIPAGLKIETFGYGGQGFTYFEAENRKGRFVASSVSRIFGKVADPGNMLHSDWRWAFAGERNTAEEFLRPELAAEIHGFEVALEKEH